MPKVSALRGVAGDVLQSWDAAGCTLRRLAVADQRGVSRRWRDSAWPAGQPVRPVCSLEAPELANLDIKRKLVQKIESAIAAAYDGIANTEEVPVLINHYPLENVGWQRSLQSDKPEIVAAIAQLNR
jgi:hypothetical protein